MKREARIFGFLVIMLAVWSGCSSNQPAASQAKKAAPDKIQGKAQVVTNADAGATDAALNAGGPSVYLWDGVKRYRLYLRTPVTVNHGDEYVAEGVYAQKQIDDIGDPDNGKNGYPLQASCEKVVRTAWSNLSFDDFDATVSLVRNMVKRYPARPLFLVTQITPVTGDAKKEADDKNMKQVTMAADKEKASLIEGPTTQPAPLWQPEGGTVSCKVVIDSAGKISELDTGKQLCEAVPWNQFKYKPQAEGGQPVKVATEVEVKFEPKK